MVCSKKNDTHECVKRCRGQKVVVVATQVQKVVTFEGVVRSTPNKNLEQYEGQPQKTTTTISRRMALFSLEQMKDLNSALQ